MAARDPGMFGRLSRRFGGVLLAAALLLRVAVPAGWMPVAAAHGAAMAPCSGHGAMAMPGKPEQPAAPAHDMPCGFGAIAETAPPPDAALLPGVPVRIAEALLHLPPAVRSGSGIGTTPGPSTGPPATA